MFTLTSLTQNFERVLSVVGGIYSTSSSALYPSVFDIWGQQFSSDGLTYAFCLQDATSVWIKVYVRSTATSSTWTSQFSMQLAQAGNNYGGWAISLSGDGNTLVFGDVLNGQGPKVKIWVRTTGTWSEQQAISGYFITSSALSGTTGDTLAISGPGTGAYGLYDIDTHIFIRSGTTWTLQQTVTTNAEAGDRAVALSTNGNTLVIGSYSANLGLSANQGAIYVYTRSGTTWTQEAIIPGTTNSYLGVGIDLSGDGNTVVSLPTCRIYTRSGTTWSLLQNLNSYSGTTIDMTADSNLIAIGGENKIVILKKDTGLYYLNQTIYSPDGLNTNTAPYWAHHANISDDGLTIMANNWLDGDVYQFANY